MNRSEYSGYCESKYIRISPYKVRKVAALIRSKNVKFALKKLKVQPQSAATFLYKALYSAYHNAINKGVTSEDLLYIDTIVVNEAKKIKRFTPRARGRGFSIIKRSSHIKIGIKEKVGAINGTKD
ncbi:50S ribosomal protein L22 [Candidatus Marinamargulisbacteria bacterium SCGC AG-333-B06]|nr:50S ribosomal protein L22 [Candidatus Marinamargulisbacteria bacterium SCGC AG-333-B06]